MAENYAQEEDFSFKQTLSKRVDDLSLLWNYRKQTLFIILGATVLGALLAWKWPKTYTARITFVVEESKPAGGSIVSALAGQFGFDMGDIGGSGGVLDGDNVQELLRSNKLIKRTLLTPFYQDSTISLADKYAEANKLKSSWQGKYLPEGKLLNFPVKGHFTRLQDSLTQVMVTDIAEKALYIGKPDKKLSFFEISVTTRNEILSKLFCERLMKEASDFYIQNKTEKMRNNVNKLQHRADSLERLLNRKTYSASAATQILIDANPAYSTAGVGSQMQERDKMIIGTIYSEVVKNLEVSKTILMQETPAFQMVDEPEYPLKKNKLGYGKSIVGCVFLSVLIYFLFLLFKYRW